MFFLCKWLSIQSTEFLEKTMQTVKIKNHIYFQKYEVAVTGLTTSTASNIHNTIDPRLKTSGGEDPATPYFDRNRQYLTSLFFSADYQCLGHDSVNMSGTDVGEIGKIYYFI